MSAIANLFFKSLIGVTRWEAKRLHILFLRLIKAEREIVVNAQSLIACVKNSTTIFIAPSIGWGSSNIGHERTIKTTFGLTQSYLNSTTRQFGTLSASNHIIDLNFINHFGRDIVKFGQIAQLYAIYDNLTHWKTINLKNTIFFGKIG